MELLAGHESLISLVCRGTLSVVNASCKLCRASCASTAGQSRDHLLGSCAMLDVSWQLPWAIFVLCSDASEDRICGYFVGPVMSDRSLPFDRWCWSRPRPLSLLWVLFSTRNVATRICWDMRSFWTFPRCPKETPDPSAWRHVSARPFGTHGKHQNLGSECVAFSPKGTHASISLPHVCWTGHWIPSKCGFQRSVSRKRDRSSVKPWNDG